METVGGAQVKPRQAFGLSVLVALSLHAVILLVPRIAGRGDPGPPTIEVSLDSLSGPGIDAAQFIATRKEGTGPVSPPVMRAASPSAPPTAQATVEPQREPSSAARDWTAPDSSQRDRAPESPAVVGDAGASTGPASPMAAPASGGSGTDAATPRFGGPGGAAGAQGEALPGDAGSTTSAPRPRGEILPAYPRSAKRAGWEGVVTISAFIDKTGRVVSAVVLDSSGHAALDQAALDAVRRTLFDPAERGARPVSSRLIIPFRFRLN